MTVDNSTHRVPQRPPPRSQENRAIDRPSLPQPRGASLASTVGLVLGSERTVVFASLAGLVLVLWIPFGPRSGLGYETAFPYMSETQSWWDAFFYRSDPLRIYTSVFYNLSYLLGRAAGVTGSFVPYQIVYAVLWFGRGVLTYEIVRRLVPRAGLLPYLVAVLVVVHASDGALNWVGQMNQFGMIFWLLLSVYFLVLAVTVDSTPLAAIWCGLAMAAVRLCLWSYESALGLVLLAPAIVLFARRRQLTRVHVLYALLFYVPVAHYIGLNVRRYVEGDGSSYQESVARSDLALVPMFRDLLFNIRASLQFWNWGDSPATTGLMPVVVGLIGAGLVIVGGVIVSRHHAARHVIADRRPLVAVAVVGTLVLVASFPAYLVLASARSLWRTQFLSGVGFGLAVAALIVLAATLARHPRVRVGVALTATAVIAYFGTTTSYSVARFHYSIWDRHRDAVAGILDIAPRIKPGTVVVYTGIPSKADPFGDTYWFDLALRLAYPGVPVVGEYFRTDGSSGPGTNLRFEKGRWVKTGNGASPWFEGTTLAHTLFVSYSRDGARLLSAPPDRFRTHRSTATRYQPSSLIESPPADERALRRYGPLHYVWGRG